jgi:hypothetical protein
MALRVFVVRELWDFEWFFRLSPKSKCFWFYILTHCDHAGVWPVNFPLAGSFIGEKLDAGKIRKELDEHVIEIAGKYWWIPDFIGFQYKNGELDKANNAHTPALRSLQKHDLMGFFIEGSGPNRITLGPRLDPTRPPTGPQLDPKKSPGNPRLGSLDKDKDKDKDRDAEEILDRWKELTGTNDSRHEAKKWVLIRLGAKKQSKGNPVDLLSKEQMLAAIDRWAAKHAHDEKRYKVRNFFNSKKAYVMDWLKDETKPGE